MGERKGGLTREGGVEEKERGMTEEKKKREEIDWAGRKEERKGDWGREERKRGERVRGR